MEMVCSHAPSGPWRMGPNPRANGGLLRQTLRLRRWSPLQWRWSALVPAKLQTQSRWGYGSAPS
ncbi:Xylulose-5-phosphate phosphoketolase (EC 4.1.2.9); Fructose-6-phosphate phosphoketolase (EC 4.1.2.22) [Candidatus Synechococcus spongiarum]|uniref:Xylulose-5-phosphate phosphoketolase n=1 Tax=Candidatus Synechococcus spongiarum TaxID=431041 RepID=A0A171DGM9_9SYNE|nr:Xylulose-5-phosphate phosphoketolase (EC 4.1.2.9); Fructose-6-phosphate phosphoketolase (EC 4.1.2.22) [Candidatus Synechococcus spongiarum]